MAAAMPISQFLEDRYLPIFSAGCSPRTLRAYRDSVARFVEIAGDLPIGEIAVDHLAAFKAARSARSRRNRPTAAATVNKDLRHVLAVLSKAGPPGPRNRDALGLLDRAPWTRPLREPRRLPRVPDRATIGEAYKAAAYAAQPAGYAFTPAAWWRALIVAALTLGFRRAALLSLRWEWIDVAANSVRLPAEYDKCLCEREKPINAVAMRHMLAIRTGTGPLVFPWPLSGRSLDRHFARFQQIGGVSAPITLHALKRACGTLYAEGGNPWIVQQMLDHASIQTSKHYINASASLKAAADALKLPAAFSQEVNA